MGRHRVPQAAPLLGYPIAAPPGTPGDRVAALRQGFDATTKDPDFLSDMQKEGLEAHPTSRPALSALIAEIYATPPAVVERAKALLAAGAGGK